VTWTARRDLFQVEKLRDCLFENLLDYPDQPSLAKLRNPATLFQMRPWDHRVPPFLYKYLHTDRFHVLNQRESQVQSADSV